MGTVTPENGVGLLKILKMELPYDPAILPLVINPKEPKTIIQNYICTPVFIAVLFIMVKI